jgi:hypothetical protein
MASQSRYRASHAHGCYSDVHPLSADVSGCFGVKTDFAQALVQTLAQSMQMEFVRVQNTMLAEAGLQPSGSILVPDIPGIQTACHRRIRCAFNDRSAIRE